MEFDDQTTTIILITITTPYNYQYKWTIPHVLFYED